MCPKGCSSRLIFQYEITLVFLKEFSRRTYMPTIETKQKEEAEVSYKEVYYYYDPKNKQTYHPNENAS